MYGENPRNVFIQESLIWKLSSSESSTSQVYVMRLSMWNHYFRFCNMVVDSRGNLIEGKYNVMDI